MTKMRKNRLFYFVSLIFVTLFFASCINITESDSDSQQVFTENNYSQALETVTLTGFISTKGALPSQFAEIVPSDTAFSAPARSAVPSITPTDYFIQAVSGGETINGTVTDGSYSIKLVLGRTYTVTAGLKEGSATLMSDEWQNVRPTRENAGSLTHNFLLKPVNTAKGFVELPITISDTSVQYVKVSCGNSAWGNTSKTASSSYTISKPKVTNPDGTVSGGITPGIYEVTISFYTGENGILLYSSTQSVTVLPNMTTNKWISGGGSAEPINSTGIFNITTALISIFARTQIYVGNTSVGSTNVVEGVDKGTGTPYAPYATVSKAVDLIAAGGTSTSDYNIWINGTIMGCTEIPNTITTSNARSITIQGYTGNTTDILNANIGSTAVSNGSTLTIKTQVPVTIKNLKITGGNTTNGGGIVMSAKTNVTLESGAFVTGNNATQKGGGVYVSGSETEIVIKDGAIVSKNKVTSNIDGGWINGGAGIYATDSAKITMSGGEISENTLSTGALRGGGVFLYNKAELKLSGGKITKNESLNCGGNIATARPDETYEPIITMTGGEISNGKVTGGDVSGGGIWLAGCKMTMSDGKISGNKVIATSIGNGAGIYAAGDSTFEMSGGEISENEISGSCTKIRGGAVIIQKNSSFKISGSASIPYGVTNSSSTKETGLGKNDIYLCSEACITVTGALSRTGTDPVATITLSEWKRGTTVVKAAETVTNVSTYKDYFAYTDEGWETIVSSDEKFLFINQPIYVAGGAGKYSVCSNAGSDDSTANGTKTHPYATLAKACTTMNDETVDYILKIDGEVTGAQEIPDTLTKTTSGTYKAKSLTLCGASGLDSNNKPQDTLHLTSTGSVLSISTNVPVTIKDLNIFGSESSSTPTTGLTLATGKSTDVTISNGVLITKNYNSGVNISSQGTLTMTGGDITTNRAKNGAGVVNDGTFIMTGGYISANITNSVDGDGGNGGGVYITSSGKLEMSGGYIIRNTAGASTTGNGGGVYFSGTFEFQGGEILGNLTYNNGGGLYADGGTLIMGGTAELGNKNVSSPPTFSTGDTNRTNHGSGGAIYSKGASNLYIGYTNTNGTPTVSNFTGCITGNYAKENGGGIYTTSEIEVFNISGGTISYNAADGNGGAIYSGGKLSLLKKAYIPVGTGNKNDVYLDANKVITIGGKLSDTYDLIATITPNEYSVGKTVLALGANSGTTIADSCTKFAVTKRDSDTKNWAITTAGTLDQIIGTRAKIVNNSILFNDGSSMPWTYSSSPTIELSDTQKQNAVAYIFKQDRSTYYGISLKETNATWAKNGGECRGYNNSESTSDSDGQTNTNAIKNLNDNTDATKYPAFYWAVNYKNTATNLGSYDSNWYVPSKNEMKNALSVFSYISSAMEKIGTPYADSFTTSGAFLTSTQYSSDSQRYVSVINSYSESNPKKNDSNKVRAMRKFN